MPQLVGRTSLIGARPRGVAARGIDVGVHALPPRRAVAVGLLAVLALGAALRFVRLDHAAFWDDEYVTWMFASEPLARLWGPEIAVETNPPLYYTLQHFWLAFGSSRFAMRALPALLGILAIALSFVLGRRLLGARGGLLAAALVATSPLHIHYSREIRAYALLTAATIGALACLAHLLPGRLFGAQDSARPQRRRWLWLGYVAGMTVAVYSHNTAVLAPVLAMALVGALWLRGLVAGRFAWQCLAANSAVAAAFAWWLPTLLAQTDGTLQSFWIPPSTADWVRSQLLGLYPYAKPLKPLLYALPLAGVFALRRRPATAAFLLTFAAGLPLLLWMASLYRPMFIVRAMVWATIPGLLLMAAALGAIRARGLLWCAALAVLGAQLASVDGAASGRREHPPQRADDPLAALVAPLAAFDPARDAMLFAPIQHVFQYRYVTRAQPFAPSGFGVTFADTPRQIAPFYPVRHVPRAQVAQMVAGRARLWVVRERHAEAVAPQDDFGAMFVELDAVGRVAGCWRAGAFELLLYEFGE